MNIKVTYIVTCYNHENYIEDALHSAFQQSYKNIHFIISDDCSSDNSFKLIENVVAMYPKLNISINKNDVNLGIGQHMNKLLESSNGDLIVMAAGDDISLQDRVKVLVDNWVKYDKPSIVASSLHEIDAKGKSIESEISFRFNVDHPIKYNFESIEDYLNGKLLACAGSTMAYSSDVIKKFGVYDTKINSEDVVYFFRGMLCKGVLILNDRLIKYRRSESSFSAPTSSNWNLFKSPQNNYPIDFNLLRLNQAKSDLLKYHSSNIRLSARIDQLIDIELIKIGLNNKNLCIRIGNYMKARHLGCANNNSLIAILLPRVVYKLIYNVRYNLKNRT
ncbi:glycosyltransferase [Vibrio vulnificus]|uniref:glycosyltransferase n=1 Tax=Vibrio vulnificus TaxID=672 RepID=UPI00187D5991|nr:glycosyltransferase [Vibrio vulnificus]